jgi:hypothetical protein
MSNNTTNPRGLHVENNFPPWGKGTISQCHLGGKNMKRGREKGEKCERKRKKGERNGRKGKEIGRKGKRKRRKM